MYRYLAFALLIQIAVGCDFPNGTETALHWWDCGDGTVKLYGVTPLDENGTSFVLLLDNISKAQ